jgi:4-carboxymuconolactone decarboxylase
MAFGQDHPKTAQAQMGMVDALAFESALDEKTRQLAYLAVLCAARLTGGIAFHVAMARETGASDAEIKSAAMVGLPAVGLHVMDGYAAVAAALAEPA